jgi:hypothetical protein
MVSTKKWEEWDLQKPALVTAPDWRNLGNYG